MPYHLKTARTEPARTILFVVALLTLLAQSLALVLSWPYGLINFALVAPVCVWGIWTSTVNSIKRMATAAFWLFTLWLWTGLTRLFFVEGVGELLWAPFLVVAAAVAVVYIYLSHQRRGIALGGAGGLD